MQQAAVADDGREQVVEVVSDAAGEPPDGLHFLRLAKMLFAALREPAAASLCSVMSSTASRIILR